MDMIRKRQQMRGQGGFTLIELLVVIAILAVLAGVVVFAVGGINDNSQDSACAMDERTLRTAVQAYRAQEKAWPASEAALVTAGFLDSESDWHDFTTSGNTVTVTSSAPC